MTSEELRLLAERYETADFLNGDPSWFMHQVTGRENQETMAFLASVLSYGSRKQFLPKIQYMLDSAHGDVYEWVSKGHFLRDIPDTTDCYYRLYTCHTMNVLLRRLQQMLVEYGSIGEYVRHHVTDCDPMQSGRQAIIALSNFFQVPDLKGVIPKPDSACKRLVMFLRWMVRKDSPVDLGLWADFIDRRSIFIPLDTHVMQQAQEIGLINSRTQSWHTVERITEAMRKVFPDDPARGDFALFGYGVA